MEYSAQAPVQQLSDLYLPNDRQNESESARDDIEQTSSDELHIFLQVYSHVNPQ